MSDHLLIMILIYGALGVLLGAAYFSALGWNVRLYTDEGAGWKALLLHLVRLLAAIAIFTICARQGATPLLSAFAGFLAARTVAVHRNRTAVGSRI